MKKLLAQTVRHTLEGVARSARRFRSTRSTAILTIATLSTLCLPGIAASQQSYYLLHQFGYYQDGAEPTGGTVFDSAGNMYGTTQHGGAGQGGTVWKMTPGGAYSILHSFQTSATDGNYPNGSLTIDKNGNLYGTCYLNGGRGGGTIWTVSSTGNYQTLYSFGSYTYPCGAIAVDATGNLYGTSDAGGAYSSGTVWKLTSAGVFSTLHNFGGTLKAPNGTSFPDGSGPIGGATLGPNGNLYGTCSAGGRFSTSSGIWQLGMVWEITASGEYTDLHDFGGTVTLSNGTSGADGLLPMGGVTFDKSGNMFGATYNGGPSAFGMVWEIASNGIYNDLHDFGGSTTLSNGKTGSDGASPVTNVAIDAAGNLYGATTAGGPTGNGMVWKLTTSRAYLDLHDCQGTISDVAGNQIGDGANGQATLAFDSAGNLYGSWSTGANAGGITWVMVGVSVSGLVATPTKNYGGLPSTATATLSGGAPIRGCWASIASNPSSAIAPASVLVPAGQKVVDFTFIPDAVTANTPIDLVVKVGSSSKSVSFTVLGSTLASAGLSSTEVTGGTSMTGTVKLSGPAPTGGFEVQLTTSNACATAPSTVTVPAGATSATFTVTTVPVAQEASINLVAKAFQASKTVPFKVLAPTISGLSLSATEVTGGTSVTGTVTLTGPAAKGGLVVYLKTDCPYTTFQQAVTVLAGATSATFTIKTSKPRAKTTVRIDATSGHDDSSQTFILDV